MVSKYLAYRLESRVTSDKNVFICSIYTVLRNMHLPAIHFRVLWITRTHQPTYPNSNVHRCWKTLFQNLCKHFWSVLDGTFQRWRQRGRVHLIKLRSTGVMIIRAVYHEKKANKQRTAHNEYIVCFYRAKKMRDATTLTIENCDLKLHNNLPWNGECDMRSVST